MRLRYRVVDDRGRGRCRRCGGDGEACDGESEGGGTAEQARARIAIQGRRLEAARRWRDSIGLTAELSGQEIDSSKMADAIEPLKAYYEAKLLHMQAIVEYKIARAALAKGIGLDSLDED